LVSRSGEKKLHGERLRVAEREVGEARQPRLEAVHDVVQAGREREREVCARAHRDAHPAPPGDRDGRAHRDHVRDAAVSERAPSREQVRGPARRGEDGDVVPEPAQLPGDAGDVLVDVVGLRPVERRHQADAQGHRGRV
jgi:hypothetical protein